MKFMRVLFVMFLGLMSAVAFSVIPVSQEFQEIGRQIQMACGKRRVTDNSVCACVARNHVLLAALTEDRNYALNQLRWVRESFVSGHRNSRSDPYQLEEFMFYLESACQREPQFKIVP